MQLIINQFQGIGDVIFSITIARNYIRDGHTVLWPVAPHFVEGLQRAYPDIEFKDMNLVNIDYERRDFHWNKESYVVPLRWAREMLEVPYKYCMRSKYDIMDFMIDSWRDNAMWERDHSREKFLFDSLGLSHDEPYNLVNKTFRSDFTGRVHVKVENDYKCVEMQHYENYSLMDWTKVMLHAKEIHTVSTAIIYLLELLPITAAVHLYPRIPDEHNFENVDYLFTKPYILHA